MSNQDAMNHPGNPANQRFQMAGNTSTKRGWWLKGNNNAVKKEKAK